MTINVSECLKSVVLFLVALLLVLACVAWGIAGFDSFAAHFNPSTVLGYLCCGIGYLGCVLTCGVAFVYFLNWLLNDY